MEQEINVPPPRKYHVGLTYNLKKGIQSETEDIEAEYDNIETVNAISSALGQAGCRVTLLEADSDLFYKLKNSRVDIVFNIAEGIYGRGREAQVPAILNFLNMPFTGSDETTLCICLDKALTKRILTSYGIKTPKYKIVNMGAKIKSVSPSFKFPLIVKPNFEGSSKGIWDFAIVRSNEDLNKLLDKNLNCYKQPMLIEEFIEGREFTTAVMGNADDICVYRPMEIIYKKPGHNIYSYNVKKNYKQYIEYKCPSNLPKEVEDKIIKTTKKIYKVLECRDFARIDYRLSSKNELYFIEINPLPGLAPGYSDYPMIAGFHGQNYNQVIKGILFSALKRRGISTAGWF